MGSWSPGDLSCIIIFYNIIFNRHREIDYMADDLELVGRLLFSCNLSIGLICFIPASQMSFGALPLFDSSHAPSILLALSRTMEELDKTYFFAERVRTPRLSSYF